MPKTNSSSRADASRSDENGRSSSRARRSRVADSPDADQHVSASVVSPLHLSVLVLNRHFAPVHVISAQRAFCLLWKELAEILHVEDGSFLAYRFEDWCEESSAKRELAEETGEAIDGDWIHTVHSQIQVPRIVRLLRYDRIPRNTVKFNRRNVFLRDEFRCQYCGDRFPTSQLSLDHVVPRSRGGIESWENIVCACLKCNVRKGGRTPTEANMKLLREPVKPSRSPMLVRQLGDPRYSSWKLFLHDR